MAPGKKPLRPQKSTIQLMFNTHDPLAERQRAERAQEDDYFRQRDHELIGALRDKSAAALAEAMRQDARMRCPQCGELFAALPSPRSTSETCPGCGGVWLDNGAREGLAGLPAPGWLQQLFAGVLSR
jgi:hypothetical protein